MKKRIFSLVMAVLMLFTFNIAANAQTTVQPRYNYTNVLKAGLSISSQQATCSATIDCSSSVTRIKAKITLQKKSLFSWSNVTSWNIDVSSSSVYRSYHYGPLDSGTYRVKVEATVYAGSASETITQYSSQVKI